MNKRILFLAFFALLTSRITFAQNGTYPWMVAYGLSGAQLTIGDDKFYKEYFRAKNWNIVPSLHFKASRHVGYGFSPQATLSVGYAERRPQIDSKGGAFVDFDLNIKYSFANGYILKEKCFFDPYIVIGGGVNYVLGKVGGDVDLGLGTNIWIFKNFGLFIQASYNYVPHKFDAANPQDFRGYMHHTMGFVTRFGQGKDRDKDGVADIDDKCPDVPGLKELNGCPDTDGDGITDAIDLCPLVPGLAAFAGCPDSDGDGIIDSQDKCPNEAGTKELKGCPDKDGDTVMDSLDKCIDVPGLVSTNPALNGCPDKDGDGIVDAEDRCPELAGTADLKGCPDTDGDGLIDPEDKCPQDKGLAELQGCPDKDGDKVADVDDGCPEVAGSSTNKGCPEDNSAANQANAADMKSIRSVYFDTGKDIIRRGEMAKLNMVVKVLNANANAKLEISGHTDNTGEKAANQELSQRRAEAAKAYLISKGIAENRISATGFGDTTPAADNNTAAGRSKNRRVDFKINN